MKPILHALAALILGAGAALADFGPLITPADLSATLDRGRTSGTAPIVLDIRAGRAPEGKPEVGTYAAGHIPGAVSAPYARFRGPADNPGAIPEAAVLETFLRGLGLRADSRVVIVHQGKDATDFGAAARVYWTLRTAGLEELAILNGGINGWSAQGGPLETAATTPAAGDISVTLSDRWLATTADVRQIVAGADKALLLDARPKAFWAGETAHPAAARPGTLPQSRYFDNAGWFGTGATTIDPERVRRLAADEGLTSGTQPIVSFCNTGHWAATNWFALSELAGIDNVKLYPDSMVGWSNAGGEMANVPGPVRTLWTQVRKLF